ncbi:probable oxidoreductase, LLM family [Nakamurella panacisegetis]|uniref:Probable oxidoreductase, LLM family n=1 Tax=Nakamurella panacisegetis TaxID=1090615 RepID=A0A1H0KFJ3_9ACTN|nr:LLM class flavin-dependent oxidoreductase [Nakamurella panacisegetis]SDO54738.1 probable oxidoreductase, LLM family [Nakamurella panacisegetis]
MTTRLELGLDTFGDVTVGADGEPVPQPQVIRNLVDQAVLADQVGLDFIGIGEHHRADFAVTAPDVVLSAIAGRTKNIHLGSAVTVLSSDDPVRVFQRFATLDAVSNGRAEVILGRGSFTESFPLFGFELSDYDQLFEEKVELFAALRSEQPVTWSGATRSALSNQSVFPHTGSGALKTWLGVGGSPESVVRAARYGFGLLLAIIGGEPERFAPYSDLFHRAQEQLGTAPAPIGVHSPGHVADTDEQAKDELWPHYRDMTTRIGRERGWPAPTRARFEADAIDGSIYVGSPETVAKKIASTVKVLGADRFDLKYSNGTLPHEQMLHSIELYGTKVAPMVRDMLA